VYSADLLVQKAERPLPLQKQAQSAFRDELPTERLLSQEKQRSGLSQEKQRSDLGSDLAEEDLPDENVRHPFHRQLKQERIFWDYL
jgi:hypothetical protein